MQPISLVISHCLDQCLHQGTDFIITLAGNVGNLPLVIVATVCDEHTSVFSQRLGTQCGQIGIAYVAFSMWVAGFVQYSVAYNLLKLPDK